MVARGNNSEYDNTRKMQETIKESVRQHMTILDNLDDYDNTEMKYVQWNEMGMKKRMNQMEKIIENNMA